MTTAQKQRIEILRGNGESYSAIATELSIPENTIKSYCRRNNIGIKSIALKTAPDEGICGNCGQAIIHTPGSKQKRFCSDKCRMAWWRLHPDAMNQKTVCHHSCQVCGLAFEAYGSSNRKYCSKACYGISRRTSDG